jgi:hypothetical protein
MYNIAQALAVRCALTLAWDEGLNNIILASGCPLLLDSISSPYRGRSLVGVIVEDIKALPGLMS